MDEICDFIFKNLNDYSIQILIGALEILNKKLKNKALGFLNDAYNNIEG